jgi:hypothetical protein
LEFATRNPQSTIAGRNQAQAGALIDNTPKIRNFGGQESMQPFFPQGTNCLLERPTPSHPTIPSTPIGVDLLTKQRGAFLDSLSDNHTAIYSESCKGSAQPSWVANSRRRSVAQTANQSAQATVARRLSILWVTALSLATGKLDITPIPCREACGGPPRHWTK